MTILTFPSWWCKITDRCNTISNISFLIFAISSKNHRNIYLCEFFWREHLHVLKIPATKKVCLTNRQTIMLFFYASLKTSTVQHVWNNIGHLVSHSQRAFTQLKVVLTFYAAIISVRCGWCNFQVNNFCDWIASIPVQLPISDKILCVIGLFMFGSHMISQKAVI